MHKSNSNKSFVCDRQKRVALFPAPQFNRYAQRKEFLKLLAFIFSLLFSVCVMAEKTTFVFAHINETIMPIERGNKYEDPLDSFLKGKGIGEVTGGGSLLSKSGKIEWVGVDIELQNPQKNLPVLIQKLKELGAPKGSFLEYTVDSHPKKAPIW